MARAMRKDFYRDDRPWRYWAGATYAYPGAPVLAIPGETYIVPEDVSRLVLNVVAVDIDAAIQVSYCNRDVLANGGGEWQDCGAGSTLGTGSQAIDLPFGPTGVRLFIHAAGIVGGTAAASFELFTFDAVKGEKIFTPEGGIGGIFTFSAVAGVAPENGLMSVGTDPNSMQIAPAAASEGFGVMYSAGVPYGGLGLVVTSGIANVLLVDAVAGVAGQQVTSSATAGRADCIATPAPYTAPDLAVRFGHCLVDVLAGIDVLARVKLL